MGWWGMSALTSDWWEGLLGSLKQPRRIRWPVAVIGGLCLGNVRSGFVSASHGLDWATGTGTCLEPFGLLPKRSA